MESSNIYRPMKSINSTGNISTQGNLSQIQLTPTTLIADICLFNGLPVISTYNSTLEVIHSPLPFPQNSHPLPFPLSKISSSGCLLLGISYSHGALLALNSEFKIVGRLNGLNRPLFIATEEDKAVIALHLEILIYKIEDCCSTEYPLGSEYKSIKFNNGITAISINKGRICIGDGNTLYAFDRDMHEIYRKEFTACISSVNIQEEKIVVGLVSGKIYSLDQGSEEDGFVFNSHRRKEGERWESFPVTWLSGGKFLISSGYDGRILKWNLESRGQAGVILETEGFIRKFIEREDEIYVLIEKESKGATGNLVIKGKM